jgi:hypothetical protein
MTIIKADPGFELLAAHHDGEFKIERSPIVAWRIEGDFAEPIALNPLFDGAFLTAVKCPSREIIARGYSLRWDNERAFIEELPEFRQIRS